MARQTRKRVDPLSDPDIIWRGGFSPERRQELIGEAAYSRYVQRGYAQGYDVEDWLAAEAEFERMTSAPEQPEFPSDTEVQQGSAQGVGKGEALKRAIKKHPQKAIPQIEGMEPEQAPSRE